MLLLLARLSCRQLLTEYGSQEDLRAGLVWPPPLHPVIGFLKHGPNPVTQQPPPPCPGPPPYRYIFHPFGAATPPAPHPAPNPNPINPSIQQPCR